MAAYFLGWLIASGVHPSNGGPLFLIYLTNWALIAFVIYLFIAACSVTTKFFTVHCCRRKAYTEEDFSRRPAYYFRKPTGCCGYKSNTLSWYQMIHWVSFTYGGELALAVTVLYWTVLYAGGEVDGINANTHLTNGIISVVDILLTGTPVSLLHFIYPLSFSSAYAAFTGFYFAGNGTDVSGNPFIYSVIDFGRNPGFSAAIVILVAFLFVPLIHLVFYAMYIARFWLVYAVYGRNVVSCWGEQGSEEKSDPEVEMEEKSSAA